MILTAIGNKLKTGSVKTIIYRGNGEQYPAFRPKQAGKPPICENPYVIVYEGESVPQLNFNPNTMREIFIVAHYPLGNKDKLDEYIYREVVQLLSGIIIDNDNAFKLELTARVSETVEENDDRTITGGNDDRSISRSRVFLFPEKWR